MRRPRVKCALCGKYRTAPKGDKEVQYITGKMIYVDVFLSTRGSICTECTEHLQSLIRLALWKSI